MVKLWDVELRVFIYPTDESLLIHCDSFKITKEAEVRYSSWEAFPQKNAASHETSTLDNRTEMQTVTGYPCVSLWVFRVTHGEKNRTVAMCVISW